MKIPRRALVAVAALILSTFATTSAFAAEKRFPHMVVIGGGMLVGPTGVVGVDGKSDINHRATIVLLVERNDCATTASEIFLEAVGEDGTVRGEQKVVLSGCHSKKFDLLQLFGTGADGKAIADFAVIRSRSFWPHAMYAYLRPEFEWPTPASFYKFGVPVGRNRHRAPNFDSGSGRYQTFFGVETRDVVNGPPPYEMSRTLFPIDLVNTGGKVVRGTVEYLRSGGGTSVVAFELPPGGSTQVATPLGFSGDIAVISDRDVIARGHLFEYQRDCYVCSPPSVVTFLPIQ